MKKSKQLDLENRNDIKSKITKPELWSSCCPYRQPVNYEDDLPSLTRQEFSEECDVNKIMARYQATGILPNSTKEPIYWDAARVPNNLQDAMASMMYANELFMQLGAPIRKEFDNDATRFVEFATNPENGAKLKEWGLTAPEPLPDAPMRVEVVTPPPDTPAASGGVPPA